MAGVAFGGVNGGSSYATLNSVGPGIACQSDSLTHSLGWLDGFCQTMFSPVCFQSGFWILVSILLLEG